MAAFGIGILLAPILGPTLGGWITDNYSWRWIFYLNLPVGILSLFLMNRFVFDPHYVKRGAGKVDLWGIGFLALGIGSLQIVLDTGQRKDWFSSSYIRTFAALVRVGLVALIIRELMTDHPVVDLRVLKNRSFSAGVFLISMLGLRSLCQPGLAAACICRRSWDIPPTTPAWRCLREALARCCSLLLAGHLTTKIDPRRLLVGRYDPRFRHHVPTLRPQSLRGILGHLLGPGFAGCRPEFPFHSADVAGHGAHPRRRRWGTPPASST